MWRRVRSLISKHERCYLELLDRHSGLNGPRRAQFVPVPDGGPGAGAHRRRAGALLGPERGVELCGRRASNYATNASVSSSISSALSSYDNRSTTRSFQLFSISTPERRRTRPSPTPCGDPWICRPTTPPRRRRATWLTGCWCIIPARSWTASSRRRSRSMEPAGAPRRRSTTPWRAPVSWTRRRPTPATWCALPAADLQPDPRSVHAPHSEEHAARGAAGRRRDSRQPLNTAAPLRLLNQGGSGRALPSDERRHLQLDPSSGSRAATSAFSSSSNLEVVNSPLLEQIAVRPTDGGHPQRSADGRCQADSRRQRGDCSCGLELRVGLAAGVGVGLDQNRIVQILEGRSERAGHG